LIRGLQFLLQPKRLSLQNLFCCSYHGNRLIIDLLVKVLSKGNKS
jgi:hypothetical protein